MHDRHTLRLDCADRPLQSHREVAVQFEITLHADQVHVSQRPHECAFGGLRTHSHMPSQVLQRARGADHRGDALVSAQMLVRVKRDNGGRDASLCQVEHTHVAQFVPPVVVHKHAEGETTVVDQRDLLVAAASLIFMLDDLNDGTEIVRDTISVAERLRINRDNCWIFDGLRQLLHAQRSVRDNPTNLETEPALRPLHCEVRVACQDFPSHGPRLHPGRLQLPQDDALECKVDAAGAATCRQNLELAPRPAEEVALKFQHPTL
mmetsp:Transcript_65597/g.182411  ORF Transcript_65597/g.182411 Transcript_65597/m.182411 type:complete len:263 (+) Transcript_65597:608-1396(+)